MKSVSKSICILILLMVAHAQADLLIRADGNYTSDLINGANKPSYTHNATDVMAMFTIDSGKHFAIGAGYLNQTTPFMVNGVTSTVSDYNFGIAGQMSLGKEGLFGMGTFYGIISRASYSQNPSTNYSWEGASLFSWIGLQPAITDNFRLLASLNYYTALYTTQVSSNSSTNVSYPHQATYPTLGLMFIW